MEYSCNEKIQNDEIINNFLKNIVKSVKTIVNDEKMINKCDLSQEIIGKYLDKLNINYYPCSTHKVISNNITGHSFIVIEISEKSFVIDPSFIQFMYDDSDDVIINGLKCISKSPYYYLKLIDDKLSNELISNGFFELNEETAYSYGNAFYFTKVSIPESLSLMPINGKVLYKMFKTGDDILSNYNIGEIDDKMVYIR